jgi:hypothetical protein
MPESFPSWAASVWWLALLTCSLAALSAVSGTALCVASLDRGQSFSWRLGVLLLRVSAGSSAVLTVLATASVVATLLLLG